MIQGGDRRRSAERKNIPRSSSAHVALLALKSGKRVKIVDDRAEDMVVTTERDPSGARHRNCGKPRRQAASHGG